MNDDTRKALAAALAAIEGVRDPEYLNHRSRNPSEVRRAASAYRAAYNEAAAALDTAHEAITAAIDAAHEDLEP